MNTLLTKIKVLLTLSLGIMMTQPVLANDKALKIGVTAGPSAQILEIVQQEAAKQGLNIQIITFTDYVRPNDALAAGELDANCYQFQPRVDRVNAERGYNLVSLAKIVVMPLRIYSKKIKHLSDLPQGAKFGIPNDLNGSRVLLLLQEQGVIKVDPAAGLEASPLDVIENPRQIRFIELEAPQMPRSLDDTHASGINTNYAVEAGLDPIKDSIAQESSASPYASVFVVRGQDRDRPEWKKLISIYHSPVVKDFIVSTFKGSVIPAW